MLSGHLCHHTNHSPSSHQMPFKTCCDVLLRRMQSRETTFSPCTLRVGRTSAPKSRVLERSELRLCRGTKAICVTAQITTQRTSTTGTQTIYVWLFQFSKPCCVIFYLPVHDQQGIIGLKCLSSLSKIISAYSLFACSFSDRKRRNILIKWPSDNDNFLTSELQLKSTSKLKHPNSN